MESLVVFEPASYLRMLMRSVVIADNVNLFILGHRLVDLLEKQQPFFMAMPLGAGSQYFSCRSV